jgi:hypothetical protein
MPGDADEVDALVAQRLQMLAARLLDRIAAYPGASTPG